ncbi:glutathione S-transferase family protein [Rhodobacter sp. 24-YEA-8]|uniref:glutathione S-transferase family protein n=1 Tax=Rhodobacter sp. 24-YEA-8 TaxID=1884310 RepID=UPI00089588E2|nr:Glutathione S-transferase [Rhodobacter sp. 24-YEA-8]
MTGGKAGPEGKTGKGLLLYGGPTSPYVRKVQVMAIEAGLGLIAMIQASSTPVESALPAVAAVNPLGKVPALVTPSGEALFDSRVITRWLDAYAGSGFYPQGDALWPVLTLEALADGILDAALLMVYEARLRPEESRFTPWIEGQWLKIARALDLVEAARLSDLQGGLTAGQIALGVALGYVDFRLAARDWRAGRPGLAAWEAGFAARPSMLETVPKG